LAPADGITSFTGISLEPMVRAGTAIALRDDDGTQHVFTSPTNGVYESPAGTWLYVRDISMTNEAAPAWAQGAVVAATRPDRVTYWYADYDEFNLPTKDGRLLGVTDRNGAVIGDGAQMRMAYECVAIVNGTTDTGDVADTNCTGQTAPAGRVLRHRLTKIIDAGSRELQLDYFDESPASSTGNRDGRLRRITDFGGVKYDVEYDLLGNNLNIPPRVAGIREAVGTSIERNTQFVHATADDAASKWVDESRLITSIVDPRGASSKLTYGVVDEQYLPRVTRFVDRVDAAASKEATTFTYTVEDGVLKGEVVVRDEARDGSSYRFDDLGRVIETTTPTGQREQFEYDTNSREIANKTMRSVDQSVQLSGTALSALTRTAVAAGDEIEVRSAAHGQGSRFEQGVDYTVAEAPLRIARIAGGAISSGATVHVSYVYARSTSAWNATTGLVTQQREPASLKSGATPTAGELETPTITTYTNVSMSGHVADVSSVTTPRGSASADPDDFTTTYTYNGELRLASTTSPINKATGDSADLATRTLAYFTNGDLRSETDTEGRTTGFSEYGDEGQARFAHVPTAVGVGFNPETTPRGSISEYDAMGRVTCVDQQEAGDPGISPCNTIDCGLSAENKTYETASFDELGRPRVATQPWDGVRRRASITTYDPNNNATSVLAEIGYTDGQTSPANPDTGTGGVVTTTTYDALDRAITTQLPANDDAASARRSTVAFDAADRVIRDVQPQGNATESKHDYSTRYQHDADGRVIGTLNGNDELTCVWFDPITGDQIAQMQPKGVTDGTASCPSSPPTTWVAYTAYDRAGNPISNTDVTGRTSNSYFDQEGNPIKDVDSAGKATTFASDPNGETIEMQMPAVVACTDSTSCDAQNKATISPTYTAKLDGEGNVVSETDERAGIEGAASEFTTTTEYNVLGDAVTTSLPGGQSPDSEVHAAFDLQGNATATTTQTSAATVAATPSNEKANWTTAPDGSVIAKVDAATGNSFTATYDVGGRIQSRTEHGVTTTYSYYPDGSPRRQIVQKLAPTWQASHVYAPGQCVTSTTANLRFMIIAGGVSGPTAPTWNTNGTTTSGNVLLIADQCLQETMNEYDRNGAEIKVTMTSAGRSQDRRVVRRDNVGRVLKEIGFTDANNSADDARETVTTQYDRNGNATQTLHGGRRTTKTYGTSGSTMGMQTAETISYVGGTTQMFANYEYDTTGNLSTILRGGTTTNLRTDLRYDAAGNLTRVVSCRPSGGVTCVDAVDGAQVLATVPQDIRYTLDATGNIRVKQQLQWQSNDATVRTWAPSTAYAVGDVVNPTQANEHQYVVIAAGTTGAAAPAWPLGVAGTVTNGTVVLRESTTTTAYEYDAQNRLVLEDLPDDPTTTQDFTKRYLYDANGRLDKIENADCTSGDAIAEQYTYDEAGESSQLKSVDTWKFTSASGACTKIAATETDIEFGEEGSGQEGAMTEIATGDLLVPTDSEVLDLGFDEFTALDFVSDSDGTEVTSRDPEGRPTAIFDGVETVTMGYVSDEREAALITEGGDDEARGQLTAPNGWLIAENRDPAGLSRYYLSDNLGTPVAEFGRSGNQLGSRDLDAYGQDLNYQASGTMTTTIGFAGERQDPKTGMTDHDARSYNPELRTWVSMDQYADPMQDLNVALDPTNSNRALYAGGNPVNNIDPDGHGFVSNLLGAVAGAVRGAVNTVRRVAGAVANAARPYVSAAAAAIRRQASTVARWKQSAEYKNKQRTIALRALRKAQALARKAALAAARKLAAAKRAIARRRAQASARRRAAAAQRRATQSAMAGAMPSLVGNLGGASMFLGVATGEGNTNTIRHDLMSGAGAIGYLSYWAPNTVRTMVGQVPYVGKPIGNGMLAATWQMETAGLIADGVMDAAINRFDSPHGPAGGHSWCDEVRDNGSWKPWEGGGNQYFHGINTSCDYSNAYSIDHPVH
jgi:RHS repeat-associated protein